MLVRWSATKHSQWLRVDRGGMDFSYATWWGWMRGAATSADGALQPTDDVCAISYTVKPGPDNVAMPFLHRGMQAFRVAPGDPMLASPLYDARLGGYVILERPDNERSRDRKWLFLVFPQRKDVADSAEPILSADHFSFMKCKDPNGVPLHLHLTRYIEWEKRDDGHVYGVRLPPANNYLPLNFKVPDSLESFTSQVITDSKLKARKFASALFSALRRPWTQHAGAGRQRGRRRAARALREAGGHVSDFASLWRVLPLRRLLVIGVRRGDVYDFTVSIYDAMTHASSQALHAVGFTLPASQAFDYAAVEHHIVQVMSGFQWDDFRDPPEMQEPSEVK